jgi:hypothetical protein
VAAGDHLDPAPAVGLEFRKQRVFFVGSELVAGRVGNHGHTLGGSDPLHCALQRSPAVRHIARLAIGQIFAEHLRSVPAHAGFHQKAREMRARHQLRIACVLQSAFVGALDADLGELLRHLLGAQVAAAAGGGQPLLHLGVVRVESESHDVDGFARERH